MTDEQILQMVKYNLQLAGNTWDDYLTMLIGAARQSITREGITLKDTPEDSNLVIMYAAYLYRKRAGDEAGMPRMLRWALNNRLFSQKTSADEASGADTDGEETDTQEAGD